MIHDYVFQFHSLQSCKSLKAQLIFILSWGWSCGFYYVLLCAVIVHNRQHGLNET